MTIAPIPRTRRSWPPHGEDDEAKYRVLSCVLTWALLPLARLSLAFPLLALFGPAAAAMITARLSDRHHLAELWSRVIRWRVGLRWYTNFLSYGLAAIGGPDRLEIVLRARPRASRTGDRGGTLTLR